MRNERYKCRYSCYELTPLKITSRILIKFQIARIKLIFIFYFHFSRNSEFHFNLLELNLKTLDSLCMYDGWSLVCELLEWPFRKIFFTRALLVCMMNSMLFDVCEDLHTFMSKVTSFYFTNIQRNDDDDDDDDFCLLYDEQHKIFSWGWILQQQWQVESEEKVWTTAKSIINNDEERVRERRVWKKSTEFVQRVEFAFFLTPNNVNQPTKPSLASLL